MRFADIPGHNSAKERLTEMAGAGRVPHALLISAPPGSGELMLARAFVQYLHCTGRRPGDADSCGTCPSCRLHRSLNHVDLHFSFPVLKKGTETLSDDWLAEWREFMADEPWADFRRWQGMLGNPNGQPRIYVHDAEALRRKLSLSARASDTSVALVWLPERMEEAAANKLLKLIEEPAEGTLLLLVSNAPGEILPTVYSRCQHIELRRLSDAEVASVIAGSPDSMAIAHIAEGNVIAAREAASAAGGADLRLEQFVRLMRLAYGRKVSDLKVWSEQVADTGRDAICRFLEYAQRMVRENFIRNLGCDGLNYLTAAESDFSARFCPFINERNVEQLIAELDSARTDIRGNGNAKIILFDLAVKVIILLRA